MAGKRPPSKGSVGEYQNGSSSSLHSGQKIKIQLTKKLIDSAVPDVTRTLTKIKLKPEKRNNATTEIGTTKSPNWREVGHAINTVGDPNVQHLALKLNLDEVLESLSTKNSRPLRTPVQFRICNHCFRPILLSHIEAHIEGCLESKTKPKLPTTEIKDEPVKDISKESFMEESMMTSPSATASPASKGIRKRKMDKKDKEEAKQLRELAKRQKIEEKLQQKLKKKEQEREQKEKDREEKKQLKKATLKKKKQALGNGHGANSSSNPNGNSVTINKPKKGPVDVEIQCGVPLKDGGLCARSLTCKTHSMGAKRAVTGRSASYDTLLAAYQRANQAKNLQSNALAQAKQDDLDHGGDQEIDSDEEAIQVMESVRASFAMPLVYHSRIPIGTKTRFVQRKDFYSSSIGFSGSENINATGKMVLYNYAKPTEYKVTGGYKRSFKNMKVTKPQLQKQQQTMQAVQAQQKQQQMAASVAQKFAQGQMQLPGLLQSQHVQMLQARQMQQKMKSQA